MTTPLTNEQAAEIYDKAAENVARLGWHPADRKGGQCIWVATISAWEEYHDRVHGHSVGYPSILNKLLADQIGARSVQEPSTDEWTPGGIWQVNDAQPPETGQAWAIENLRELARKLRIGEVSVQ